MVSTEALTADWNALSTAQQLKQWSRFTLDLDAGEGAFHRYYLVLAPMWRRGDVPAQIEELKFATAAAEAADDAAWELEHESLTGGWMDYGVRQAHQANAIDYGEPVF